jgi:hypothetical protein
MKSLCTIAIITTFALSILAMPAVGQPPVTEGTPAPAADLPTGVIVMWSGQLDAIPVGWALCDGSDGTPDLSNRFVLGAGAAEYLGSTGGSRTHKHRAGNHTHQIDPPALRLRPVYGYSGYRGTGTRGRSYTLPEQTFNLRSFKSGPTTVIPDSVSHLPPYYKIAFIMKR